MTRSVIGNGTDMEVVCCVYRVWCTQGSPDSTVHNNHPQTVRRDAARNNLTGYTRYVELPGSKFLAA